MLEIKSGLCNCSS